MKTTSIIRDRGQLTIPDTVRDAVSWLHPLAAIDIFIDNDNQVILTPHAQRDSWEASIKKFELAQTFTNKSTTSSTDIINQDRLR